MLPNRMYPSSKPIHNSDLTSIVNQIQSNFLIQQNSSFETFSTSSNGNTHKSQSKLKVLESKQLGDMVLQFREKQCGNKLKLRHKRYATAIAQNCQKSPKQQILKQKAQQNTMFELQKTKKQANFKKKISQALKSIKLQQQQKSNSHNSHNSHNSTVRKNPTTNPTIQSKISVFPSSLHSSKSNATQSPSNDKIQQISFENDNNRRMQIMDKNQYKYHQPHTIYNGDSLLVQYRQFGNIKQIYSMDEIDDDYAIKFGQQNKQKRRNKKSKNILFKSQFQQQKLFKQTTDSNTKRVENQQQKEDINTNTKDTITYLQLPPNAQANSKLQNKTNPTIQKYSIHTIHITEQKNKQNKLPSSQNYVHHHQQHKQPQQTSTRTQTQPQNQNQNSNTKQQKLQQQLSTRIGLPAKLHQHVKTNSLPIKLQDINNQLDLGLKIIDDSFQISAIDQQAGSHQLWVVTSMDNNKNSFVGSARIDRVLGMRQVQDIILDESIVSPQCQQLKQKLNSLLQQRKQKQHNYISQQNSMDGDVDDILMHLPILQINSFHKQSVNNCTQMHGQRIIKQEILSCQQNSVQKMGVQSRNKFVIVRDRKNRGQHLFVNQVQYSITKDCTSSNIQAIKQQLKYLLSLQQHSNIISLYDYTIKQQHDKIIVQTLKQPTLYPMYKHSPYTTPYMYKINNILNIQTQNCKINQQNAKNIIRQLLSTIIFLNQNQNQITNNINIETFKNKIQKNTFTNIQNKIKISLENVYLMQIQSVQNKQYILKLDISNYQNIDVVCNFSQYQTDIYNIEAVINIIKIIHNITKTTLINQKLCNNFIQVLQQHRHNLITKSQTNKNNGKQIGDKSKQAYFWRNLSMHPYIYNYIQCSKEYLQFGHVMF